MNNIGTKKINTKLILPIIIIVLLVGVYFIYKTFFSSNEIVLDTKSNLYVSGTKLGQHIDTLNKENLIFTTNINNQTLSNLKDFYININPSSNIGRKNPFLP